MTAKTKNSSRRSAGHHRHKPRNVSAKAFERVYWPYLPLVLIVSILLMMSGQSGALSSAIRHPSGNVLAYATSMSSSGLLSSTNSQRASNGVGGLSLNSKLNSSAQAKANDMAARNYWSHNTPEGDAPWVFVTAQGYAYQKLGENLAAGFSSEDAAIGGWMASASHRANLLDPAFSEVGFGFANNENYTAAGGGPMTIVVAHYGKPSVLAAAQSAPPSVSKPSATKAASQSQLAAAPTETAPLAETPSEPAPAETIKKPFTSEGSTSGAELAGSTSRIQSVLGNLPAASMATGFAVFGIFVTLGLWISRHALAVRRAVVMGETFALRHPLVDIGLVSIAALLYLLSRTAGFIQ